jgi:sarcosine oxidase delta subunit
MLTFLIRRYSRKDRKDNFGFFVSPKLLLQLNTVHFILLSVHFVLKYAQTEKKLKSKNKYLFRSSNFSGARAQSWSHTEKATGYGQRQRSTLSSTYKPCQAFKPEDTASDTAYGYPLRYLQLFTCTKF